MTSRRTADRAATARQPETGSVRVWDPFVRVFHWGTVALFAAAFVAADEAETLHQIAGYAILGLIPARIAWGFVGPRHARFADFLRAPRTTLAYVAAALRGRAPRHLGHNPAGGAMVVALLGALLVVTLTGAAQTLDAFADAGWVEDVHEFAAHAMLALIALHLAGVLFSSIAHGENLVAAMFTGRKRREAHAAPPASSAAPAPADLSSTEIVR